MISVKSQTTIMNAKMPEINIQFFFYSIQETYDNVKDKYHKKRAKRSTKVSPPNGPKINVEGSS